MANQGFIRGLGSPPQNSQRLILNIGYYDSPEGAYTYPQTPLRAVYFTHCVIYDRLFPLQQNILYETLQMVGGVNLVEL